MSNIVMQVAGGEWEPLRNLPVWSWDGEPDTIYARYIEYLMGAGASMIQLDCRPRDLVSSTVKMTCIVRYKPDDWR